jgi:hypothetical protein
MDPTKNFDHLDPKLKETYARVMGTAPSGTGDITQNSVAQPATSDPSLSTTTAVNPPQDIQPQNQYTASPMDQPLSPFQNPNMGPNPGTGPMINSIPTDTTTIVTPPVQTAPTEPAQDMNAPATSSFFSNPSPATTDPTQNPTQQGTDNNLSAPFTPATEPASAPVTPYSPENQTQYASPVDQTAQPLPSPSTVAQSAPKETSALLRVLYIIGAVIFFAIYTVFWIKVFNLPFLF